MVVGDVMSHVCQYQIIISVSLDFGTRLIHAGFVACSIM